MKDHPERWQWERTGSMGLGVRLNGTWQHGGYKEREESHVGGC